VFADDELGIIWKRHAKRVGRLAFPLIPCTETGATVRMANDGPSSWTTFLMVGRPREKRFLSWGVTSSRYEVAREKKPLIGGKPLALMELVVEASTRPGDLVCDPCCGAGTTLLAAKLLGRRWIGGDLDATHAELARERLRDLPTEPKLGTLALRW